MNMIIQITTAIAMILSIIVPFGYFFLGEKSKKRYKKSLIANCFMFFGFRFENYRRFHHKESSIRWLRMYIHTRHGTV